MKNVSSETAILLKRKDTGTWDPLEDVSSLPENQQQKAKELLRDQSDTFARGEDDDGCVPGLEMHIKLKDQTPVQRTYQSISRPLCNEGKAYLQDLLEKGWITKSESPYSTPVVLRPEKR